MSARDSRDSSRDDEKVHRPRELARLDSDNEIISSGPFRSIKGETYTRLVLRVLIPVSRFFPVARGSCLNRDDRPSA